MEVINMGQKKPTQQAIKPKIVNLVKKTEQPETTKPEQALKVQNTQTVPPVRKVYSDDDKFFTDSTFIKKLAKALSDELKNNGVIINTKESVNVNMEPVERGYDPISDEFEFANGEILVIDGNICIFKSIAEDGYADLYAVLVDTSNQLHVNMNPEQQLLLKFINPRRATRSEVDKLFNELEINGYKWSLSNGIELKRWKPTTGEKYYCLLIHGACEFFAVESTWTNSAVDEDRWDGGNCFIDKGEANVLARIMNAATQEDRQKYLLKK